MRSRAVTINGMTGAELVRAASGLADGGAVVSKGLAGNAAADRLLEGWAAGVGAEAGRLVDWPPDACPGLFRGWKDGNGCGFDHARGVVLGVALGVGARVAEGLAAGLADEVGEGAGVGDGLAAGDGSAADCAVQVAPASTVPTASGW